MSMNIKDAVVLVTGANRGLGQAWVQALLAGGVRKVYAASRTITGDSVPGVVPVELDITDPAQVARAAAQCGDLTLLINNAGISRPGALLDPDAADLAQQQFDTNYFGTLAMCRAFAPLLAANGGGAIINVLSVLSWITLPGAAGYCASKAAAWSMTNALRQEVRAQGTQVLALHVGFMDTDMTRGVDAPKAAPADVVASTLAALAAGADECLADALSRQVKEGLSMNPGVYLGAAN